MTPSPPPHPGLPPTPATVGSITPTARAELDAAVAALQAHKNEWAATGLAERIALLEQMIQNMAELAPEWVALSLAAKGLSPNEPAAADEWLGGPYLIIHYLRRLRRSLLDIQRYGRPQIPGSVTTRPNGQVVAPVFPQTLYDRLFYPGLTAEVWMQPEVTPDSLPQTQALAYQEPPPPGRVALVLGAGNVSCLGPTDLLHKLFTENQVVIYKTHEVTAYLKPLVERLFAPLRARGAVRVVAGGPAEGAYLAHHPGVDEIHLTGSDKTFEAIVFGPGPAGAARKAARRPLLTKRVTGELGNVSPVIVTPGPWTDRELRYHAANLASMLVTNAGFNCLTTRVIILPAGWPQREQLLAETRRFLAQLPPRRAYYPGAQERYRAFLSAHPEAEKLGQAGPDELPWTLIPGLEPDRPDEICFTTEAFCSLFAETALPAPSVPAYLERAVAFANERLWGTLNATLLVHPSLTQDPNTAPAVERAIAGLRYGTVAINHWAAVGYGLVVPPWGGFPGQDIYDIQSGNSFVHNTLLFSRPQKAVIRGPFIEKRTPLWFATHRYAHRLSEKLTYFEANPVLWRLPGLFWLALRG